MLGLTIVDGKIEIRRKKKKDFRQIFYFAWKHNKYPPQVVNGVAAAIRQTYGEEKNWPGYVRKYWLLYQIKRQEEERNKR
jgi:hypothetical protein